jgi:hypothetical protein
MKAMSMDELDRLLDAARATPPQPGPDLMARILAEALAEQPIAAPVPVLRRDRPARRGFWAALAEGFGGPGVLAGLGGAACFGLALGYVDPATLGWLTDGLGGTVSEVQLLPGTDFFLSEG